MIDEIVIGLLLIVGIVIQGMRVRWLNENIKDKDRRIKELEKDVNFWQQMHDKEVKK